MGSFDVPIFIEPEAVLLLGLGLDKGV